MPASPAAIASAALVAGRGDARGHQLADRIRIDGPAGERRPDGRRREERRGVADRVAVALVALERLDDEVDPLRARGPAADRDDRRPGAGRAGRLDRPGRRPGATVVADRDAQARAAARGSPRTPGPRTGPRPGQAGRPPGIVEDRRRRRSRRARSSRSRRPSPARRPRPRGGARRPGAAADPSAARRRRSRAANAGSAAIISVMNQGGPPRSTGWPAPCPRLGRPGQRGFRVEGGRVL